MPWFHKREEATPLSDPVAPPPPPTVPGTCSVPGCQATQVYHCVYADSRGEVCGSPWCQDHIAAIFPAGAFCRRHRNVALSLASTTGSVLERAKPNLDDRRYSLIVLLVAQLDQSITAMLQYRFSGTANTQVATDVAPRATRRGSEVAWEQGWSAYAPTGNLGRVVLRVPEGEPPVVRLMLDQNQLLEEIPGWIADRPPTDAQRLQGQAAFRDRILAAVQTALGL